MRRMRAPWRCAQRLCCFISLFVIVLILSTCILYNAAEHDGSDYVPFPNSEGKNWREQELEVPAVLNLMGVPYNAAILEIGTGRAVALPPVARLRKPHRLVGVDISEEALRIGQNRLIEEGFPNVELIQADARHLPFPDHSVDVIMDFGTLYHISNQTMALREIARVLKKGGMMVSETQFSQFTSHPWRSWGRKVPWHALPCMQRSAWWLMWEKRINNCNPNSIGMKL